MSDFRGNNRDLAMRPAGTGLVSQLVAAVLVIGLAMLAGYSLVHADWTDVLLPVVQLSALAAVLGVVLAKTPWPASMAHFLAMGSGMALTLFLTLRQVVPADGGTGWLARLQELGRAASGWYLGDDVAPVLEAQLVSFLMASILWLVGYLAAWCLFRHGWVFATVILPGFLILVNLGFAGATAGPILVLFGLFSLLLLVRQNLIDRQDRWRKRGIQTSGHLGTGFLFWGSLLATVATLVAVAAPTTLSQATFQPLLEDVGQRATTVQQSATDMLDELTGRPGSNQVSVSGSFSSFGDSFAVGGPLNLSDTPAVLAAADGAPYLSAQALDGYTGRGWFSTVEDTFEPVGGDGQRYSPEMTFSSNQDVPLSASVTEERTSQAVVITPLTPTDGLIYTVDTYQTSNLGTSVRMSWRQLDGEVITLQKESDIAGLPRELRPIATLLLGAEFGSDIVNGSPAASDPDIQAELERLQRDLGGRFLNVTWTADDSGAVSSVVVSGQIPVYDDVEAVSASGSLEANEDYRVVALTSRASAEQLANAGTEYPDWVNSRYLPLPETVTPRTIELALDITAPYENSFDKARALETFIRETMIYDETVTAPPGDADIVDYLLFERQRGYCEYSASAMTVMLRAVGIPARVVVGFAPGTYDDKLAGYMYLQSNAHAWTEAYFPGFGWIPFEPTSSESTRDDTQAEGLQALPSETPVETEVPATLPPDNLEGAAPATPSVEPKAPDSTPTLPGVVQSESDGGGVRWLPLAIAAVIPLVVGAGWLLWTYPFRNLEPGSAFYFRLRRLGAMFGVRPAASATPREFGRAMAERAPTARRQIEQIVKTYELDQYGPQPADSRWLSGAADAWRSIRQQVPMWLVSRLRRRRPEEL
jgi:transglutaminase-like putative cysteine protease